MVRHVVQIGENEYLVEHKQVVCAAHQVSCNPVADPQAEHLLTEDLACVVVHHLPIRGTLDAPDQPVQVVLKLGGNPTDGAGSGRSLAIEGPLVDRDRPPIFIHSYRSSETSYLGNLSR